MLRVLHLTDTHVVAREDPADPPRSFAGAVRGVQGATTSQTLDAVLAAVTAEGVAPDLLLHTGDVTDDGEAASYQAAHRRLAQLGAPVLAVPGNHDHAGRLAEAFGHTAGAVRIVDAGGWRVVAVDRAVQHRDSGRLSSETLADIDAVLTDAPGPVLLGLHHPPHSVCPAASCGLEDAGALLALLGHHPRVRAVASGHTHVAAEQEHAGVQFLLSPSTCLQLRHDHPLPEHNQNPTPVGARVIELDDDGSVSTRLIWAAAS